MNSGSDLAYAKKVIPVLKGYLNDKLFLNMVQKEDKDYKYSEDELALLYKMNMLLETVIIKLHLYCELETSLPKIKNAIETGELDKEKMVKMIQSGDMKLFESFIGGKRKTKKRTKKYRKSKKSKKSKKTKRQRGGTNNGDVAEVEGCPICMLPLTANVGVLSCTHKFHTYCVNNWLPEHHNCPICRTVHNGFAHDIHNPNHGPPNQGPPNQGPPASNILELIRVYPSEILLTGGVVFGFAAALFGTVETAPSYALCVVGCFVFSGLLRMP